MSLWSRLFGSGLAQGMGYVPCGPSSRDYPCSQLLGRLGVAQGQLPSSIELMRDDFPIFDQQGTSSCSGCSLAQGLRIALAEDGKAVPQLSPLFLYYNARREDAPTATAVRDLGTTLRSAMTQVQRLGACPESRWPLDPARVNARPAWLAYRDGADYRGLRGYYRCGTIDEVKRALAARRPVVIGLQVDKAFLAKSGPAYIEDTPGGAGGHAMLLTGYDAQGRYRLVNSWGTSWREGGRALVGEAFVRRNHAAWALDT